MIVAAVCHRPARDGHELLIVRTKGGKRWTFPKGHVEPGETERAAAAREAREEAGVEGEVAVAPLTQYRYPSTRRGERESLVTAYLLLVRTQGRPARGERERDRTWVPPVVAVDLLSERREPEYAEEHARVVAAACAAFGDHL